MQLHNNYTGLVAEKYQVSVSKLHWTSSGQGMGTEGTEKFQRPAMVHLIAMES